MPVGDLSSRRRRSLTTPSDSGTNGFLNSLTGGSGLYNQTQLSPAPTMSSVYSPQTQALIQQLQTMAANPTQGYLSPFTQTQYPSNYPSVQAGYPSQGVLSGLINRW